MCGIFGFTGNENATSYIIDGLEKLQYRGYDSVGITLQQNKFNTIKTEGNIVKLQQKLNLKTVTATCGVGHTRWATHGSATEINAHPHLSNSRRFALVLNGVIENYLDLKKVLDKHGFTYKGETDAEVLVNWLEYRINQVKDIVHQLPSIVEELKGRYAFALLDQNSPGKIIGMRKGSPLVVSEGNTGFFLSSDATAFPENCKKVLYIEDEEYFELSNKSSIRIYNSKGESLPHRFSMITPSPTTTGKGDYAHYMLKEINEQAKIIRNHVNTFADNHASLPELSSWEEQIRNVEHITLLGCGTSWHAALTGKYFLETITKIPTSVDYASEYRYRNPIIRKNELVISISQSGETADILTACSQLKEKKVFQIAICNAPFSSLARELPSTLLLQAGVEVGVASTKAFTAQLIVMLKLAWHIKKVKTGDVEGLDMEAWKSLPDKMVETLKMSNEIKHLAKAYTFLSNFLFIGRGINYPSALEGALKLKEISYIHAEGYPAAELKHGPLALIDDTFPVLIVANELGGMVKNLATIKEIKARNGHVIALVSEDTAELSEHSDIAIKITSVPDLFAPILAAIPLQFFSYYMALNRKCNIDQPRNLAKSVTVE